MFLLFTPFFPLSSILSQDIGYYTFSYSVDGHNDANLDLFKTTDGGNLDEYMIMTFMSLLHHKI